MAISGIIEVAGIASILPFLSLITNVELIQKNKYLFWLYNNLNFHSTNRFLIFIGFVVLAILIISNVFVFLTQFGLSRFSWMRNYAISRRLFSSYLYQPYVFFLNRNTTVMGKNILTEVQQVIKGIFSPFLQFFSQGIVAIFIFALLLYSNPVLAIILVVVLGGIYMFVYRLIRNKIYNIGKRRFLENAEQFKSIGKAFGDIKLLKLTWSEKYFIDDFSKHSREFARSNSTNQIIGYIPRYIMEIIAFGGIIIVILYLLATRKSFEEFLPLVGLYAF
ncbi:MAG: ABC transporter transmembrane domain-containing protein, partial [Nitrososphaeraceae archaeon]